MKICITYYTFVGTVTLTDRTEIKKLEEMFPIYQKASGAEKSLGCSVGIATDY